MDKEGKALDWERLERIDDLPTAHLLQPVLVLLLRCLWLLIVVLRRLALLQSHKVVAVLVLHMTETTTGMSPHSLEDASLAHKGFGCKEEIRLVSGTCRQGG